MSSWNPDESGELIAIWDSADPLPAPACFDRADEPDLVIPAGQHPIEGQFWLGGDVLNARIWIPTSDRTKRRPIEVYVWHLELEFHYQDDSPLTLLPDLEFYEKFIPKGDTIQGLRRIDLGRRIVERLQLEREETYPEEVEEEDYDGDG